MRSTDVPSPQFIRPPSKSKTRPKPRRVESPTDDHSTVASAAPSFFDLFANVINVDDLPEQTQAGSGQASSQVCRILLLDDRQFDICNIN